MTYRLSAEGEHALAGCAIDRAKPIRFKVNGRTVHGFQGDSVLSALLSGGILAAGSHLGAPIGLTTEFGPLVSDVASGIPSARLPSWLTPAYEGAQFIAGQASPAIALLGSMRDRFSRPFTTLGVDFEAPEERPGVAPAGDTTITDVGVLVIGGGIAGMAAALAAAELGRDVVIIERRFCLGGDTLLFGNREGEPRADKTLADLIARVTGSPRITVRLGHSILAVNAGIFDSIGVGIGPDGASPRHERYRSAACVLATGTADRLPIVPGNRLPGVMGIAQIFHLAWAFGVWPARKTIIAGGTNAIYQLALLGQAAGKNVSQVMDDRMEPQSRFREYCKAYGVHLSSGTSVRSLRRDGDSEITISTGLAWEHVQNEHARANCDLCVLAGGWAPRLRLWVQAGGHVDWSADDEILKPTGKIDHVVLAGSAAGLVTNAACIDSGTGAVETLLGQGQRRIADSRLPGTFESPDSRAPILRPKGTDVPAYLSRGLSLAFLEAENEERATSLSAMLRRRATSRSAADFWLEIEDIEALLRLGAIQSDTATQVIAERARSASMVRAHAPVLVIPEARDANMAPPAFLSGRFGSNPGTMIVEAEDERQLEVGCLLFESTDNSTPKQAIGVVFADHAGEALALMDKAFAKAGLRIAVRSAGRVVGANVVGALKTKMRFH